MPAVDMLSETEAAAGAVQSLNQVGKLLLGYARDGKDITKAVPASRDLRREAYLQFQAAVWRASSHANLLIYAADLTSRPLIKGRPADSMGRVLTLGETGHAALVDLLDAMSRLRMVGTPEPRRRGEEMLSMVSGVYENLPLVGSRPEKAARQERLTAWQSRIGEAQKQFTEVCRVDLGYAKLPRAHWWQLRRPRTAEDWPGGWPGPQLELDEPRAEGSEGA